MQYPILIEKGERNYSAYSPDVPGCVVTGQTVEELTDRMRSALVLHIESLKNSGQPVPEPSVRVGYVDV